LQVGGNSLTERGKDFGKLGPILPWVQIAFKEGIHIEVGNAARAGHRHTMMPEKPVAAPLAYPQKLCISLWAGDGQSSQHPDAAGFFAADQELGERVLAGGAVACPRS